MQERCGPQNVGGLWERGEEQFLEAEGQETHDFNMIVLGCCNSTKMKEIGEDYAVRQSGKTGPQMERRSIGEF